MKPLQRILSGFSTTPTIASWECPAWIRRRWRGAKTDVEILDLFLAFVHRTLAGELTWR